ncbi:hypothetical protein N9O57_01165 [bacterium]|nr:hypothetical protein [bacterium]
MSLSYRRLLFIGILSFLFIVSQVYAHKTSKVKINKRLKTFYLPSDDNLEVTFSPELRDSKRHNFNAKEIGLDRSNEKIVLRPHETQDFLKKGLIKVRAFIQERDHITPVNFKKHKSFYINLEDGFLSSMGHRNTLALSKAEYKKLSTTLSISKAYDQKKLYLLDIDYDHDHPESYLCRFYEIDSHDIFNQISNLKNNEKAKTVLLNQEYIESFMERRFKNARDEIKNMKKRELFGEQQGTRAAQEMSSTFNCSWHKPWLEKKFNTKCIRDKFLAANGPVFVIDPGHFGGRTICDQRAQTKYGLPSGYAKDPNSNDVYREGHGAMFMALRARNMFACMLGGMDKAKKSVRLTREGSFWIYSSSGNLQTVPMSTSCSNIKYRYNRDYRMGYIKSQISKGADYVMSLHTNASGSKTAQFPIVFSPRSYHSKSHEAAKKAGQAFEKYMYGIEKSHYNTSVNRKEILAGQDRDKYYDKFFRNVFFFSRLNGYSTPRFLAEAFFNDTKKVALMLAESKTEREVAIHPSNGKKELIKASPILHYGAESVVGAVSNILGCGL